VPHFIMYSSHIDPDIENVDELLQDIISSSSRNNKKRDITGVLFFHKGTFIQALEGSKEELKSLMDIISSDPRHRNICILFDDKIIQRNFPNWLMAALNLEHCDSINAELLEKFSQCYKGLLRVNSLEVVRLLNLLLKNQQSQKLLLEAVE